MFTWYTFDVHNDLMGEIRMLMSKFTERNKLVWFNISVFLQNKHCKLYLQQMSNS